jgi:hypothetical protein
MGNNMRIPIQFINLLGLGKFLSLNHFILYMSIYFPFTLPVDRGRRLREIAERLGFQSIPHCTLATDPNMFNSFKNNNFSIFNVESDLELHNVMKGRVNRIRVYIGDYIFKEQKKEEPLTIIVFSDKNFNFPVFSLGEENIVDRLEDIFYKQDIDFEANRLFSDRYFLRGNNEIAVRNLFKKRVRDILESYHKEIAIEGSGTNITFFMGLLAPEEIERRLIESEMILNSF